MSALHAISVDLNTATAELTSFKAWLATAGFVGETRIVAEIRSRPHVAGLLKVRGSWATGPADEHHHWRF
jgi:hypothetical protein